MQEHFTGGFALGIIDRDKQELDYMKHFFLVLAKGNIELHKHLSRNHFIIRIIPAKKFILFNVGKAGINIEDFGLPVDFDKFRKATKMVNSKKDERFRKLFKALREHKLNDLELLSEFIKYLVAHPFNADLETLKAM
jgi:hypothetical protein